jgi:hypothetical protein
VSEAPAPEERPSERALPTAPLTPDERAAYMRCDADAECVGIDIDCCTLCNGGTAMPVRRDSVEAALAKLKPKDCSAVTCTELACDLPPVGCVEGRCQFKIGGALPQAPAPAGDAPVGPALPPG